VRIRTAGALVVVLVAVMTACSPAKKEQFDYLRVTVDGQQTLGISKPDSIIRGVVVYFHGPDADEFALTADQERQDMTGALVNAGFAVVSSYASGNAFGNEQVRRNYQELANMATSHYKVENLFFLAESMGTITALNLLSAYDTKRIRGLAAINPATDLQRAPAPYLQYVAESYPDGGAAAGANPMNFPPDTFAGNNIRFYVDSVDGAAIPAANARAFTERFGADSDISIVDCGGADGASCVQGDDLLKWFSTLERRVEP
jgi:pimeloyl-ACP methyl ester carboxylesterase